MGKNDSAAILGGLPELNLPAAEISVRTVDARPMILDPTRGMFVALTPEEWVRQHVVAFLVHHRSVPSGLISIEKAFSLGDIVWRADIVVWDRTGVPVMIVECKAPSCKISQSTFDQVGRYNRVVGARYVVVTNGLDHYCYVAEPVEDRYSFISGIPDFAAMSSRSESSPTAHRDPSV